MSVAEHRGRERVVKSVAWVGWERAANVEDEGQGGKQKEKEICKRTRGEEVFVSLFGLLVYFLAC